MGLLQFRKEAARAPRAGAMAAFVQGYSMEVMPRTAEKVADFRALLPAGTRVYIAHLDGTPNGDMVATARRLRDEGFSPMPHFPARSIPDAATLQDWITRYSDEAGVTEGLILAGGIPQPRGDFHCSMQLLETGLFDKAGFTRLHVAGHPEGSRDIDPDGGETNMMAALGWKQAFAQRTDAEMAIVTQFAFEAGPVIAWADRVRAAGVDLPIHIGVAGPAKLQTLVKYAIACGVGPSLAVLQRRARDVSKLVMPFTPDAFLGDLAQAAATRTDFPIQGVHFFPLGGIKTNAAWLAGHGLAPAQET
ncbi:methylenetetrahydrofolate reductase [Rhodovulum adriaticum]|uniref:Methylenetetrahydrofolate reductase (NADPH) n=1 Tax=Rhodovulum adriaticum TaxID=35804 RepID=A0A4R2NN08_RHOAD|nr:methylenetetrahydrofolate reductase [Rhodovulum adriaticum]MBK1634542.1 5,10-methylenetetrahydrofolate reductase [Rhodovulum adriaticum]TCP23089.1 methylenetetrahydrofolate reductase (NADPH) [Rhodovulum adriaticum]